MNRKDKEIRPSYRTILLLTLAVGAVFLILCFPTFETSDDATIIRMVDGSRGSTDPRLIYQNVILGCMYILLYKMPLSLPWYSLFQYAVILLSMSVLAWGTVRLLRGATGLAAAAVLSLFLGFECLVLIQYTKTAGLAAVAGVTLLLLQGLPEGRGGPLRPTGGTCSGGTAGRNRLQTAAGILLIVIGSLYRFRQAVVCIVLMGGALLFRMLINAPEAKACHGSSAADPENETARGGRRTADVFRTVLFPLLLAGFLVIICYGADSLTYRFGKLSGFKRFDAARIELLDHGMPEWKEYSDQIKALGISRSAYRLLKGWTFADPDVFTAEALEGIGALKGPVDYISKPRLKAFVMEVPQGMLKRRFFWFFLACVLIWLLSGRHEKKDLLCALYGGAAFAGLYYYLFCNNRCLVNRVDVPMLLALGMALLIQAGLSAAVRDNALPKGQSEGRARFQGTKMPSGAGISVLTALIPLIMLAVVLINPATRPDLQLRGGARAKMFSDYAEKSRALLYQVSNDSGHLYLAKLYTLSDDYAFGVFETAPKNCLSNILWLGGWSCRSGCYLDIMDRYGIVNPMKDMIDNGKVLLVDNKIERTLKYLHTYYGDDITANQAGSIGGFPVYSIIRDPEAS